jgi:2',3'-cyclic-nucleotide 2'-phosphodiesterase / 3'-nucleotidase
MMQQLRMLVAVLLTLGAAAGAPVTITLLATTDLHGNIYPVDYYTGAPSDRGLAKIATLIEAVRRENPNTILIDCGDTIEGTPLESLHQQYMATGRLPLGLAFARAPLQADPMMLAMNRLGYQAMVLGNHEFNFGLKNLHAARKDARFPWLSANTITETRQPFQACTVVTAGGVKVGIIGITTPAIPSWEKPENYWGYRWTDGPAAAEAAVAALRRDPQPAIIVAGVHAGLGNGPENMVTAVAQRVAAIDAIVFGHTHQQVAGETVNGVLLVQPKNWGMSLARIDFTVDGGKVIAKHSRLIPVTSDTAADAEILALARPYHELAGKYLDTVIAASPAEMDARYGRVEDTPIVDAIQAVQLYYARADVSFTPLFNPRARIPKGPLTVRQIAALYVYDNELYAIEGNGQMVKDALENAARYFRTCPDAACSHGPLIEGRVAGFNFDMAEGVSYEIDLGQPAGQRIVNLRYRGEPLAPDRKLRIAVNNYRAGGSAGYTMFRDAKIVWRSAQDLRSLMIAYYSSHKLPKSADGNWRILPAGAENVLKREAATAE